MNEFSESKPERRQSPRTKLAEIAYIGMGPENGGLVLDVSEGGLSFHAVAPLEKSQTLRFLLSVRGQSRVEGAGEVVWTNDTRTVCGLKFTSLSSDARAHLNSWADQSKGVSLSSPVAAVVAADGSAWPTRVARIPAQAPDEPERDEASPDESTGRAVSVASPPESDSQPLFAIPPADQPLWANPGAKQESGAGLFAWVLFVLLGAAIVVAAFLYGVHVGQSQVIAVEQRQAPPMPAQPSTATNDVAPSPSQNASNQPAGAASSEESSSPNSAPSAPADPGAKPAAPSASASDQRPDQATEEGKTQFAAAMADLNGTDGQRDIPEAIAELWRAVGNGNSDAEVILAGLYADGFGVTRNCEQGRILLLAAERSGNPKAKPKLDELNARGCK